MYELIQKSGIVIYMACVPIILIGCFASTSMSSRVNREYIINPIDKVMLLSTFQDLELQDALDVKLKESFAKHSVLCFAESDIFFSLSQLPPDTFLKILDNNGIDAIIVLSPLTSGTTQSYIPKTSVTTEDASGRIDQFGNITLSSKSRNSEYGGYYVDEPWASFEVSLYETRSFALIWYATAKSKGNEFATWKTVIRSMAGQTVSKLAEDGIID